MRLAGGTVVTAHDWDVAAAAVLRRGRKLADDAPDEDAWDAWPGPPSRVSSFRRWALRNAPPRRSRALASRRTRRAGRHRVGHPLTAHRSGPRGGRSVGAGGPGKRRDVVVGHRGRERHRTRRSGQGAGRGVRRNGPDRHQCQPARPQTLRRPGHWRTFSPRAVCQPIPGPRWAPIRSVEPSEPTLPPQLSTSLKSHLWQPVSGYVQQWWMARPRTNRAPATPRSWGMRSPSGPNTCARWSDGGVPVERCAEPAGVPVRRDRRPVRHDREIPGGPRPVAAGRRAVRRCSRGPAVSARGDVVADADPIRPVGEPAAHNGGGVRGRSRRCGRGHGAAVRHPARDPGRPGPADGPEHLVIADQRIARRGRHRPGGRVACRRDADGRTGRGRVGGIPADRTGRRHPGRAGGRVGAVALGGDRGRTGTGGSRPAGSRSPGSASSPTCARCCPPGVPPPVRRRREPGFWAGPFEEMRDAPATAPVFLATLGTVAEHAARAGFAANLFAAGGVDTVTAGAPARSPTSSPRSVRPARR